MSENTSNGRKRNRGKERERNRGKERERNRERKETDRQTDRIETIQRERERD